MHTPKPSQNLPVAPTPDFEGAVTRLLPDLRRRARYLTGGGSATEDLVQDTMERALRFQSTFVQGSNLRAWLMRILSNTFISGRRRQSIERRVLEEAAHDPNGWTHLAPSAMKLGLTRSLERELDRLPPRIGMTLRLVDLEEASYREAALVLDVPVGTVMSRLHRGRARLAEALSGGGLRAGNSDAEPTALSA